MLDPRLVTPSQRDARQISQFLTASKMADGELNVESLISRLLEGMYRVNLSEILHNAY